MPRNRLSKNLDATAILLESLHGAGWNLSYEDHLYYVEDETGFVKVYLNLAEIASDFRALNPLFSGESPQIYG